MSPGDKSFTVSPLREGNHETFPLVDETSEETSMKPISVKALAARVLARNQKGNFNETCAKQRGNFLPENEHQKFHGITGENQGATTRPNWCKGNACEHFHRVEIPDLPTVAWCCFEQNSTHWRRLRIGAMRVCPLEMQP